LDRIIHKRYLDYRECHVYFGRKLALMSGAEFAEADSLYRVLEAKGDTRDDEEEARFLELAKVLFRD
jgi:hypothetical protein